MAIALVSSVSRSSPGSTGDIDTTGATLIVIVCGSVGNVPTAIADSASNTWSCISCNFNTAGNSNCQMFVCENPTTSATHNFTFTGSFAGFAVAAFSGTATTFVTGMPTVNSGQATSVTSIQAGSVTPDTNNCLVVAGVCYRDTTTLSINGGFTIAQQQPFVGGTAAGVGLAYLVQTSAAAANPTWSWTNAVNACACIGFFQTPVSAGSGGGAWAFA